tara:strand:- start:20 stop:298 length:279 start_codon:yes stop_codon:yes gene_type:complete
MKHAISHNLANILLLLGALPDIATRNNKKNEVSANKEVTRIAGPPSCQSEAVTIVSFLGGSKPEWNIAKAIMLLICPRRSLAADESPLDVPK